MIGGSEMKQYEPQVHTMVFRASSNELIALGHVVTQYNYTGETHPQSNERATGDCGLAQKFPGQARSRRITSTSRTTREIVV
jgi:hypothetical protein